MIHILAGRYKGRRLLAPPPRAITRPMTGLAKKSLLDTLAPWMDGAVVADLYCGTGTMGIEALSRGARRVYFAERDRQVVARLRENLRSVGAEDAAVVWVGDVERQLTAWTAALAEPLDVAFVDPPYADAERWDFEQATRTIFEPLQARLAPQGRLVLRVPRRVQVPPRLGGLSLWRHRQFGDMDLTIWAPDEHEA